MYREVKASERLPDEGKEVAVIYPDGRMCGGIYGKSYGGFYDAYGYNIPEVSVWLEPIEEEEMWRPGMDYFSTQIERLWIDSPLYGPTKAQVLDAWHKSFDIVLSKLKGKQ